MSKPSLSLLERAEEVARRADGAVSFDGAEEIAQLFEGISRNQPYAGDLREWGAQLARSTIQNPKTREQVLEEALRQIRAGTDCAGTPPYEIARRALEWKP